MRIRNWINRIFCNGPSFPARLVVRSWPRLDLEVLEDRIAPASSALAESLYVASYGTNSVLGYDGTTGAFIDPFVHTGCGEHHKGTGYIYPLREREYSLSPFLSRGG
jgi:hypothetical protein